MTDPTKLIRDMMLKRAKPVLDSIGVITQGNYIYMPPQLVTFDSDHKRISEEILYELVLLGGMHIAQSTSN